MGKVNAKNWLDAGLAILSKQGSAALTLERLCKTLNKTRGSFYHHFRDMDTYIGALLDTWQKRQTIQVIEQANTAADPRERMALLDRKVRSLDHQLDQIIRAWATRDPRAANALAEVDRMRLAYLQQLFEEGGFQTDLARDLAELEYTAFLGAQQRFPNLESAQARRIYELLRRAFEAIAPFRESP